MNLKTHLKNLSFLVLNEIKKMYSGSVLGILWFFVNPVLYSLVYYFLFDKVLQVKFAFKIGKVSYFNYLIIGLILWNSFASGLLRGTSSLLENAYLLKKVFIPAEYFPIVYSFIPFVQGMFFLSLLIFVFGAFSPELLVGFVIGSLNFYVFLLGLSLFLSSLSVYIRDIPQLLNNFLNFLFYSVPILYPYENVPDFFRKFLELNPLFYIFKPFHDVLFYKELDPQVLMFGSFLAFITCSLGFLVFRRLKEGFYDVL